MWRQLANLGELAEFLSSAEFRLDVGSDTYLGIDDLVVHIEKSENRTAPIDVGPMYRFGFGNNYISGVLIGTGPEWISFNTNSQIDSEGDMVETTFKIVGVEEDGTAITLTATGVLKMYEMRKDVDKVKMDFFIRIIGDEVTVA